MLKLEGKTILLRALEPEDLNFLYELENNTDIWEVSGTVTPYSLYVLKQYLENAHRDIYEVKQLRLAIGTKTGRVVGLIDLFDFDPKNRRVGLGLVISGQEDRNKGIGSEAVALICQYAFTVLGVHQLYANVLEDNSASIHLFEKMGFEVTGRKKDWILSNGQYKNELLFQKLHQECI